MAEGGFAFEDLMIGQAAERVTVVSAELIDAFAAVSGDRNPVHVDAGYAAASRFGERIAHGLLAGALISAVLGMDLPGEGAIYVEQTLSFRRPVRIGDEVTVRATVTALDAARGRATLQTTCLVGGKTVVDGQAIIAPRRRGASGATAG